MNRNVKSIILAEPSALLMEGLGAVIAQGFPSVPIFRTETFEELRQTINRISFGIVLINPVMVINMTREFNALKKDAPGYSWIGISASLFRDSLLASFDQNITIHDKPERLISVIQNMLSKKTSADDQTMGRESLTDRETDVLKLLVAGKTHKEIGEKLNISTHTVISHRKNISQKTGIKSVSGLTIYAVANHLVPIYTVGR